MKRLNKISESVYTSSAFYKKLTKKDYEEVIISSYRTELGRSRLCCHDNEKDEIQEMIVTLTCKTYIRAHKHIHSFESGLCLSGESLLIIFDENGLINETIHLTSYEGGACFYYKIPVFVYHTFLVLKEPFIFYEISKGPFSKENTVFAPWAPNSSDKLTIEKWKSSIKKQLKI